MPKITLILLSCVCAPYAFCSKEDANAVKQKDSEQKIPNIENEIKSVTTLLKKLTFDCAREYADITIELPLGHNTHGNIQRDMEEITKNFTQTIKKNLPNKLIRPVFKPENVGGARDPFYVREEVNFEISRKREEMNFPYYFFQNRRPLLNNFLGYVSPEELVIRSMPIMLRLPFSPKNLEGIIPKAAFQDLKYLELSNIQITSTEFIPWIVSEKIERIKLVNVPVVQLKSLNKMLSKNSNFKKIVTVYTQLEHPDSIELSRTHMKEGLVEFSSLNINMLKCQGAVKAIPHSHNSDANMRSLFFKDTENPGIPMSPKIRAVFAQRIKGHH